ncbi:hypothetical protein J1N35_022065 [Gossypium stocksii]|uniref:Uncharacterized protein n=1 Tax=Gossypium stocksii TaxID=47602 RepID=A0A9D3VH08_9ROSI|nr:hypothetical protein J1N35_022065 [Gossypium stocksii]
MLENLLVVNDAAYSNLRLDQMSFVDKLYKLEHMYNLWRNLFSPVSNKHMWPLVSTAPFKFLLTQQIIALQTKMSIDINLDTRQYGHLGEVRPTELCEWCKNLGYTMSSYPHR